MKKQKQQMESSLTDLHGFRSILSVLSKDHDDLRSMIEVLKSESDNVEKKKKVYKDFSKLLKSHAKCEEKAVYEMGLVIKDLKVGTFEAYEEHEVAATLMKRIEKTTKKEQWMGRVKVLAEVVEHHIKEEENEYLLDLKEKLKANQETEMVEDFIDRREHFKIQPKMEHNGFLKSL